MLLAPSERVVVDVLFDRPGELALEHHTPDRTYRLAAITVGDGAGRRHRSRRQFEVLRTDPELAAERAAGWPPSSSAEPDKTLAFVAEMDMGDAGGRRSSYACPMHPRGRERGAGPLPGVRHEAAGRRGAGRRLRLPDAPRGRRATSPAAARSAA